MSDLDHVIRRHRLKGFTLWPSGKGGWQANAQNPDGSWRVEIRDTPSEAVDAVLATYSAKRSRRDDEDLI